MASLTVDYMRAVLLQLYPYSIKIKTANDNQISAIYQKTVEKTRKPRQSDSSRSVPIQTWYVRDIPVEVLDKLIDHARLTGWVSIADYFALSGFSVPMRYVYDLFGWTFLALSRVRVRSGDQDEHTFYYLDLPPAKRMA